MALKRPPPIEASPLRARARPVDTFVRPEGPLLAPDPAQSNLFRLADSLSSLSPKLAQFGAAYQASQANEADSAALGLRLNTTRDELSDRIRKGDIPPEVNRDVLDLEHGEDVARSDFEDIRKRYQGESTSGNPLESNAFDRNTGDLDAWFKEVAKEKEKALPSDGSLYGWRKQMLGYQKQLYAEHDGFVTQRTKEKNLDGAYRDLYQTAVGAVASGERDPLKIHGAMREAFAKTAKVHLLSPQETDAAMAVVAKSIADQGIPGNPQLGVDIVKEIFLGSRDGVPPLGNSAQYADAAVKTIESAQKTAGDLQRKLNLETAVDLKEAATTGTLNEKEFVKFVTANPHIFSDAEKESLLLQNRTSINTAREKQGKIVEKLALEAKAQTSEQEVSLLLRKAGDEGTLLTIPEKVSYTKADGEIGAYSRQELVDRAVEERLHEIDVWAQSVAADPASKGVDVEALKLERQIAFFKQNPVKNPQWADVLNSAYSSAAPDTIAGASQPPPHLLQAVSLYESLEAKAPGVLQRHLASDDAKDFYATYRVARTLMRQDERQALITASQATKGVADDPTAFSPAYDKLEDELSKAESSWPWAQGITNYGEMTSDVRRLGKALVRAGVSPTSALEKAGESVRGQYTNINGYMVRTADRFIEAFPAELASRKLPPEAFEDTVKSYLSEYVSSSGIDADGLSIRRLSDGVGSWAVIDASTGFPIATTSGLKPAFTASDLIEFAKAKHEGKIKEKLEELRNPRSMAPHNLIRRTFGFDDLEEDDEP